MERTSPTGVFPVKAAGKRDLLLSARLLRHLRPQPMFPLEPVGNIYSTWFGLGSPLAWPLSEHSGIKEIGLLETCTHMPQIPACQDALITPYLLKVCRREGRTISQHASSRKSNFQRGGRDAGYAWVC